MSFGVQFYRIILSVIIFLISIISFCQNTDSTYVIGNIVISGNKVTKVPVIVKELTFQIGDTINKRNIETERERSIQNILKTSLFNYVYIEFLARSNNIIDVNIEVEERWYLWVSPIFEQANRNLSSFLKDKNWDMVNYGASIEYKNFRGRQESIKLRFRIGYYSQLLLNFDSPEYKNRWGWGAWINYNFYDQTSVKTIDDQPFYLKTIGTQIYRSLSNAIYIKYRSGLYQNHRLVLNYVDHEAKDTVLKQNPYFLPEGRSVIHYFDMEYRYTYDKRDSKYYPLLGKQFVLELKQSGLGIYNNGMNFLNIKAKIDLYEKLASKLYAGSEWTGYVSTKKRVPYFYQSGIGYSNYLRGYEYYVMDGSTYFYSKNHFKYELLSPHIKDFNIRALSKFSKVHYAFYINLFYDFGYVKNAYNNENQFVNDLIYGYGAGLDFVTIYDLAFSFNYARNKMGEGGFFVHVNVKI